MNHRHPEAQRHLVTALLLAPAVALTACLAYETPTGSGTHQTIAAQPDVEPGLHVRLTTIAVPEADIGAWEAAVAQIASAARAARIGEPYDWLVYRSNPGEYLVVSFSNGPGDVLTPTRLTSALRGTPGETAAHQAVEALHATEFEVVRDLVKVMRADWSTVAQMSVSTHPRTRLVERVIRPGQRSNFDRAVDDYVELLVELEYPYPVEGFAGRLGAPDRAFLAYHLDDWSQFDGPRRLALWADERGESLRLQGIVDRLRRATLRTERQDLEVAAELSH